MASPIRLDEGLSNKGAQDIYTQALESKRLLAAYAGSSRLFTQKVAEYQRRFLAWASFLGVFAQESVCLDRRLQNDPEIKGLVLSMLWVLNRNIQRGIALHPSKDAVQNMDEKEDAAMYGINGAIDRLHRLAMFIRESPRTDEVDEVERVRNFVSKRQPDGFSEIMSAMIQFLLPDTEKTLQSQLADSIVYRRHRLLWRRRHARKLGHERGNQDVEQTQVIEAAGQRHSIHTNMELQGQRETTIDAPPQTVFSSTLPSQRLPKRPINKRVLRVQQDHQRQETRTERSSNPPPRAKYPARPENPLGEAAIKCEYCLGEVEIPLNTTEEERDAIWRNHLNADLRPYVCLSEECLNFPTSFSTMKEWKAHMRETHRPDWTRHVHRIKWYCQYCTEQDQNVYFWTQDQLARHMAEDGAEGHPRSPDKLEIARITARGKRGNPRTELECPLCGIPPWNSPETLDRGTGTATEENLDLYQHMSTHLQHLALLSLSWWADDIGQPEQNSDEEASSDDAIGFNSDRDELKSTTAEANQLAYEGFDLENLRDDLVNQKRALQNRGLELDEQTTSFAMIMQLGHHEDLLEQLRVARTLWESGVAQDQDKLVEQLQSHRQAILDVIEVDEERMSKIIGDPVEPPYDDLKTSDVSLEWAATRYNKLSRQLREAQTAEHTYTEPRLRDMIIDNFVEGFSTRASSTFLPEGVLHQLSTPRTIVRELENLNPASITDLEIFEGALHSLKKVFAILCFVNLTGPDLYIMLQWLVETKISDRALPATKDTIRSWFRDAIPRRPSLSDAYFEAQWKFLVPIIFKDPLVELVGEHYILPFSGFNTFPLARQAEMPSSHMGLVLPALGSHLDMHKKKVQSVAFRVIVHDQDYSQRGESAVNRPSSQVKLCEALIELKHPHLVDCIGHVIHSHDHFFVFDLDGRCGSLDSFCESSPGRHGLTKTLFKETLLQMRGLADALRILHKSGHSHGHLEPDKIHMFQKHDDGFSVFKISSIDVNSDPELVSAWPNPYSNQGFFGIDYEVRAVLKSMDRPSANDMWSFGCTILVWLTCCLYGRSEMVTFRHWLNTRREGMGDYAVTPWQYKVGVRGLIPDLMDYMANDPACPENTALRDLLDVLRTKLLVVRDGRIGSRMTSTELRDALDEMLLKTENEGYFIIGDHESTPYEPPSTSLEASLLASSRISASSSSNEPDYGLVMWYTEENPEVDIVFVHGLASNRESTWKQHGILWPRDFLPHDVPKSRIMSFGYDSNVSTSRPSDMTRDNLDTMARSLSSSLQRLRSSPEEVSRPIVFVAHSLGGLICARLIVLGEITTQGTAVQVVAKNTKGLLFFGTPFAGSSLTRWGIIVERIFDVVKGTDRRNNNILKAFDARSREMQSLGTDFPEVIQKRNRTQDKVQILFFYETRLTYGTLVVDQRSASYPGLGETVPIQANHIGMCRFGSLDDEGYS
ncbi:hypothetical protein F66182_6006 [Fusarium sp. NRRL 66182]|nr:hypothetical protein F66182_6006 [Fusarium sp. NRRL 66182]